MAENIACSGISIDQDAIIDDGSCLQYHFIPVYSGAPYLAMNLYVTSATIDGIDLTTGDQIGIFDGDLCVGAGILEGPIEQSFSMVASTDDPGTPEIDGFIAGNS